jgi:hypothetical protein
MPKIPECDHCQYFANTPYMVCGINPSGPKGSNCEDFRAFPEQVVDEMNKPLGGGYYAGDWIPQPFPPIFVDQQLALLNWHPLFTGRCPNCETPIPEPVNNCWNCRHCEWKSGMLSNPTEQGNTCG